jgi:hypothetical protein
MKRVMITWTEHTRETRVFEVEDDDPILLSDLHVAEAEDLICSGGGYSKNYAVEDREITDVEVLS